MAVLNSGDRLGVYEIVALLGRGGMGAVYRAIDTRLNRPVAVKVVDEEFSERFQQEARAISSLNHPSVCTLYDVGANYLVMELIEGETLADKLKSGPLPVERAVEYGAQIARALAAAHAKGVVHRDLKPANIMVTRTGAKVLDFGVAKVDMLAGGTATISRAIVGTPAYMAPEQLAGRSTDTRTDIFALGLILAEMLTGVRPGQRAPLFPAHVPPRLARVVERCLSIEPDDRWQAAADIGWELTSADGATSQPPRSKRERWIWAAAVVLLAGIAGAMRFAAPAPIEPAPLRFSVPPPERGRFFADLGLVATPVISPDGRTLAFVATVGEQKRIWIRALDSDSARVLAGTEGVEQPPFWSPDSRSLAFLAESKLKRIAIAGGPPRTICDVPAGPGAGSWSSKGVILFGFGSTLSRVSADGGAISEVRKPDPSQDEDGVVFPEFLPDGDRFFYLAGVKSQKGNRVYLGSLSSPRSTFLTQVNSRLVPASPGHVMYIRERTLLAQRFDDRAGRIEGDASPVAENVDYFSPVGVAGFSVSANGVLAYHASDSAAQLTWINRAGVQTGTVAAIAGYQSVRLSPDGKRLALDRTEARTNATDVHVFDLMRGTDTRVTSAAGSEYAPIWSPDGRRLVFSWDKDAPPYLHQLVLDSSSPAQPLVRPSGSVQTPGDWRPDGTLIAYEATDPVTASDVWVLPMTGDRTPTAFVKTRFNETAPRFSPDGRWLAYVSDEAGQPDVYVRPFPGPGEAQRVSSSGGARPRWRHDGKELFYIVGQRMMAVPVSATTSLDAGAAVLLFDRKPARIIDFDVTADGQSFLINSEVSGPETKPMNIVVNWMAALKK
jgi:Tol biopolymer transport system component/predicted Ser/Thr protein kinase